MQLNHQEDSQQNNKRETRRDEREQRVPNHEKRSAEVLSPGQWLRAVTGFEAPFGHDGLPTVWG